MDIKDCIIYEKTIPAHPAVYDDFPENLLPELAGYLKEHGIEKLYCHQTEMFEKVTSGKNVVITTSTASGKTLSFLLPVLQDILKNPLTRAIFIYPTKALAADQYRAIAPYLEYFGENRIVAGVYDGDTPVAERTRIRQSANIILTNPEMVNGAFLPNHSKYGFDFIFSNLKYIVIDELHTYRGAFGSHLANVFRRLSRVCRFIIPIRSFFAVLLRSPIRWSLQQRSVESSLHLWIRTAHQQQNVDIISSSRRRSWGKTTTIMGRFALRQWRQNFCRN